MRRVGLGCMRLSTEGDRDEQRLVATVHAALDAGLRTFDTARAYGLDETDLGHNERAVGLALGSHPLGPEARVVTKGGMARAGRSWKPDGRASTLRADAEASLAALGRPIDLYLVHAPDPRVAWATTLRELARSRDAGVVREVGLSNVTLDQLDRALDLAPIRAVQSSLNLFDDSALRSGVLARCVELGLEFLAHSPLGGPKNVARLLRHPLLGELGAAHGVSPAVIALAAVLELAPIITVIPGARRPETARDAALAETFRLDAPARARLREAFPALKPLAERAPVAHRVASAAPARGEIVLLMGLQGAGKSAQVEAWVQQGYTRLNRDELGSTLEAVARRAQALIAEGTTRLVLDNTYVTRASRASILDVASAAGLEVRGLWIDVPLHEAQVNVIWRMLERHRRLLSPEELKRGKDNTFLPPLAQLRMAKDLEVPTQEEGFTSLEVVPFVRKARAGRPGLFAAEGLAVTGAVPFAWRPRRPDDDGALLLCPHEGGPPSCWCRPPLPGLLLAYSFQNGINLAESEVHGTSDAHEVMALVVGARFVRH